MPRSGGKLLAAFWEAALFDDTPEKPKTTKLRPYDRLAKAIHQFQSDYQCSFGDLRLEVSEKAYDWMIWPDIFFELPRRNLLVYGVRVEVVNTLQGKLIELSYKDIAHFTIDLDAEVVDKE